MNTIIQRGRVSEAKEQYAMVVAIFLVVAIQLMWLPICYLIGASRYFILPQLITTFVPIIFWSCVGVFKVKWIEKWNRANELILGYVIFEFFLFLFTMLFLPDVQSQLTLLFGSWCPQASMKILLPRMFMLIFPAVVIFIINRKDFISDMKK